MKSDRMDLPQDASRFEFTTLHFGALQGLAMSIEEMLEIGQDEIWAHDMRLADAVIEGAMRHGSRSGLPHRSGTEECDS